MKPMIKLVIEMPEADVREAVNGIPPDFFQRPGYSPIRTLAFALKKALEEADARVRQ